MQTIHMDNKEFKNFCIKLNKTQQQMAQLLGVSEKLFTAMSKVGETYRQMFSGRCCFFCQEWMEIQKSVDLLGYKKVPFLD